MKQGDQEAFKSPMNPFDGRLAHGVVPEDRQDRARPSLPEEQPQPRPTIIDEQRTADPMTVRHTGGAVIDIRGLPTSRGTSVKTSRMITAINLQRGPTFASPSATG